MDEGRANKMLGPSLDQGGLRFQPVRRDRTQTGAADEALETVFALRSELAKARSSGPVQQIKEQLDTLIAQLSQVGGKKDRRAGADAAMLQGDYARLSRLWDPAEQQFQDLLAAEELAMRAYFSGQNPEEQVQLAREFAVQYRRKLVYLFLAADPDPSQIVLRLREVDEGRPLADWLPPLLSLAETMKWALVPHVWGDKRPPANSPGGRIATSEPA